MPPLGPDPPPPPQLKNFLKVTVMLTGVNSQTARLPHRHWFLVKKDLECSWKGLKFENFSGGHTPRPPWETTVRHSTDMSCPLPNKKSCMKPWYYIHSPVPTSLNFVLPQNHQNSGLTPNVNFHPRHHHKLFVVLLAYCYFNRICLDTMST